MTHICLNQFKKRKSEEVAKKRSAIGLSYETIPMTEDRSQWRKFTRLFLVKLSLFFFFSPFSNSKSEASINAIPILSLLHHSFLIRFSLLPTIPKHDKLITTAFFFFSVLLLFVSGNGFGHLQELFINVQILQLKSKHSLFFFSIDFRNPTRILAKLCMPF